MGLREVCNERPWLDVRGHGVFVRRGSERAPKSEIPTRPLLDFGPGILKCQDATPAARER